MARCGPRPSAGPPARPARPSERSWTSQALLRSPLLLLAIALLAAALPLADAAKKASAAPPGPGAAAKGGKEHIESIIEDVSAKQLERVLNEKDFVAVFWCKCAVSVRRGAAQCSAVSVNVSCRWGGRWWLR